MISVMVSWSFRRLSKFTRWKEKNRSIVSQIDTEIMKKIFTLKLILLLALNGKQRSLLVLPNGKKIFPTGLFFSFFVDNNSI